MRRIFISIYQKNSIKNTYLCFLCVFLLLLPFWSSASCANWQSTLGDHRQSAVYTGVIGGAPIRMMLHYNPVANAITGSYGYASQVGTLRISGRMLSDYSGVSLTEINSSGRKTGYFKLVFTSQDYLINGQEKRVSQSPDPSCSFLAGSWTHLENSDALLHVRLAASGDIDPKFDASRHLNEVVAQKLRRAMLGRDKVLFASLLQYPFYSEDAMQRETRWDKPSDVINNYDKIVPFSESEIKKAVPHFLETAVKTEFMHNSLYIENGKVTRVCEDVCSISSP